MSKKIMIQGTGSTVGKSLLVAGLCRILNDEGHRVAPFKSQNMALNSYITEDKKEMGRAQVVQAEAARIKPDVSMNPILLKPTSQKGSQIILNGDVYKNLSASEYTASKGDFLPHVKAAFSKLEERYDTIVIEGAGSPAEINLRDQDLVNMGLAELVDSNVILVGDIDKGGVFASIFGTVMILEPNERERIKGFIINKFRGDVSLLVPGIKMLEDKINIPCLGVIPYMKDLNIEDEDSVTDRLQNKGDRAIKIGVIRLPYMSNFTDFTAFEMDMDVDVAYISHKHDIEKCDILIIPGSKSTLSDMQFLMHEGFSNAIYAHAKSGKLLFGICGGFQMLGNIIHDPSGVESNLTSINGLGLLHVETIMANEKTTVQSGVQLNDPAMHVTGYEIHMGISTITGDDRPFGITDDGRNDGAVNSDGNVIGTYLHGIFDNSDYRNHVLNQVRNAKGLNTVDQVTLYCEFKEAAYNRLASVIKENIDMDLVYKFMK